MESFNEEEEDERLSRQQQTLSGHVTITAFEPDMIIFNRYKQSLMESLQGSSSKELEKIKVKLETPDKEVVNIFPPFGNSLMYNYSLFFFPGVVADSKHPKSYMLSR